VLGSFSFVSFGTAVSFSPSYPFSFHRRLPEYRVSRCTDRTRIARYAHTYARPVFWPANRRVGDRQRRRPGTNSSISYTRKRFAGAFRFATPMPAVTFVIKLSSLSRTGPRLVAYKCGGWRAIEFRGNRCTGFAAVTVIRTCSSSSRVGDIGF